MRIVIDPGHGGSDPGAVGPNGLKEAHVNLAVALKVAEKLRKAGVEVKLTRTSDVFIDLQPRCDIANSSGADYFVSIHCNSAGTPEAKGTETYCYKFGGQGEVLAKAIQAELIAATGRANRGVKTANYYVLRRTNMPAVLVELAFINNPKEEALLRNGDFQRTCAESIAQGILQVMGVDEVLPGAKIKVDGKILQGFIKNDLTYAPVRALAEALGYKVAWDDKTRTVTITKEAK